MPSLLRAVSTILAALSSVTLAVDTGLDLDGKIDEQVPPISIRVTVAAPTIYNSGGTISVNGWTVTVPKNLQVGFPAAWIPWKDFAAAFQAGSLAGYQVSVVGNVIPSTGAVAAQISVSQFFTQASQGFISQINTDGSIKIANGPTIRINDPNAVYSAGHTAAPFMTADDQNPSISSFSGFPMCVPRSATDEKCPSSNRPTVTATGTKQGVLTAPDPLVMAPFVIGDFVEYSGFENAAREIICYSIVATNIQIVTGSEAPSYVRPAAALIGVFTSNGNAEEGSTRFVGYTSAAAGSPLTISAIDIDPCTGKSNLLPLTTAVVDTGAARLKFDKSLKMTVDNRYTREYLLATQTSAITTRNGITAGRYVQPITEWIQPELTVPGNAPLANDFSAFNHLTKGLGPDVQGNLWGPLDPFPQSGVKVFDLASCTAGTGSGTTPVPLDTVKATSAAWTSTGGGTLSVTCTSDNSNTAQVAMTVDYVVAGATSFNNVMTASTTAAGTWTFSGTKIKQASSVTCKSKAGGTATLAVTPRRRRRSF